MYEYSIGPLKIKTTRCNYFEATGRDGQPYLLELPASRLYDFESLVGLKNDYEISSILESPQILKAHEIIRQEAGIGVIKEMFQGNTLESEIDKLHLSIPDFLDLAYLLADCVGKVHARGVVHRDISPSSFLVSPDLKNIKLSYFGHATTLSTTAQRIDHSVQDSISPFYMSPEQTGRMNRSIDYRTDIYSLGVLFYKLVTGRMPYDGNLSEIIHAHIAKQAVEPHLINRAVPPIVSEFILRMMSKNAENRYQSISGLKTDIKEIKERVGKGHASGMVLGEHDHYSKLRISEKLYGRNRELDVLMQSFNRAREGHTMGLMVSGYSGIGKTRLINEVQKPIIHQNGFFVFGKFDQYQKDLPFNAFGQAFGSLVRYVLAQGQEAAQKIAGELQPILEDNGSLLTDIIPELNLLIGQQEAALKLGFTESRARFLKLFERFISVLATAEHPLVLFIDDLQWADSGSLDLIEYLLLSPAIKYFMIIGAYRDNEVNLSHPLMMMLGRIREQRPDRTNEIQLKELDGLSVNELLADTLHTSMEATARLSALLIKKSQGNPFFIRQFLEKLEEEKLLYYSDADLEWKWNEAEIDKLAVTANVIDLVELKIKKLSKGGQFILNIAAFLGNRFDLHNLSIASEYHVNQVSAALWESVEAGFVNPLGNWNKHYKDDLWEEIGVTGLQDNRQVFFQFNHDRIQQAAYSLISPEQRAMTHLCVARLLNESYKNNPDRDMLFDVVNHFNNGSHLIQNPEEINYVATLNYEAGERAKNSNAYIPALNYIRAAINLVQDEKSALYQDLLFSQAEAEYLCGNFDQSEQVFDKAINRAGSALEKAELYAQKMRLYENTQRHAHAIDMAKKGLAQLGIPLPVNPSQGQVMLELVRVKFKLRGKTPESLFHRPAMSDPALKLAMRILMNIWGPAYLLQKQNLLVYFILKMVNYSITHGNAVESALAYAFYGFVVTAQLKDAENGFEFSRLGIRLNEKFQDNSLRSKVYVIAEGCVSHWKQPYEAAMPGLQIAYQSGVATNDLIYAGYAVSFMWRIPYYNGEHLESVYEKLLTYAHFSRKTHNTLVLHFFLSYARIVTQFLDREPSAEIFHEYTGEKEHFAFIEDWAKTHKIPMPLAIYYFQKGYFHYVQGDFSRALDYFNLSEPMYPAFLGLAEHPDLFIFQALTIAALLKQKPDARLAKKLKKSVKMIRKWALSSPQNFGAKYDLILAEQAAAEADYRKAVSYYSSAERKARSRGMHQIAGMVHERWSELEYQLGINQHAEFLIREAWIDYTNWGAYSKLKALEKKHPFLLEKNTGGRETVERAGTSSIDLNSVVRASNSLSQEVVYEKLLISLLDIAVQNAGAQKGFFITPGREGLSVEAFISKEGTGQQVVVSSKLSESPGLSRQVVNYVFNSRESLILNNASFDLRFARDSYIEKEKPLSVLCMPVMRNNEIVAILYLENNLATDVFTEERLEILQLLSGQMAISLQNAELYETLEARVNERTATIENQKKLLEEEKGRSDRLLLNMMPEEIAHELKTSGKSAPRQYSEVTILFTDFEGFSKMTKAMSATELVSFLDDCFRAFDQIMKDHGLEKIKTIGDAYMSVSGLPYPDPLHAHHAVRAALDILRFIERYNRDRLEKGLPYCQVRVGIHTGPVVAGIVGSDKFAYDLWGDTVNIAARLESYGEPGRINISDITYHKVKDQFECQPRGKITVKHNEEIQMYFVNPNAE